jgi:integrase
VAVRFLRSPSYRLHKPTGQAVVTLTGRDIYLGKHGSPESRSEYDRLLAEWLGNGRKVTPSVRVSTARSEPGEGAVLTVNELLLAYLDWADGYYMKNGEPTSEPANIRLALRPLRKLYGHTSVTEFGPKRLKTVRQAMIDSGLCRSEVNKRVRQVVRAFKWGVGEELVPASTHHGLRAVSGLRRGRADVRESEPVKPVPESFVDAIRPHVSRQVWAMIELQRLSGMRPGEVCQMRTIDLDTSGRIWVYRPESHKTEHHGRGRVIHFGPQAQEILRPWLQTERGSYLFSPAEATAERLAAMREKRRTPVQPSQTDRKKPNPEKTPGERYDTDSYRRAIQYGCKRAGVPGWHPQQLRHNAATRLRKEFSLDTARAVLGHSSTAMTEIYAELDGAKAAEAMERVG